MAESRYSVYVLEAATTNRLTYFLPPLVSFKSFYSCKFLLSISISALVDSAQSGEC